MAGPAALMTASTTLIPSVAVAQDEDGGGDAGGGEAEGESMLVFFYNALGIRYTIVFLAISFAFVAIMVMIFMQLRRAAMIPPGLADAFEAHVNAKQFQEAFELVKADDSYLGHQLAAGMGKLQSGYAAAIESMQDTAADDTMKLEHKVSYVALIGALAPMFGLLGTVDGMVASFMVIARSTTAPKPKDLAMGISMALITTLVGLWLAIPAIGFFAMFKNWLQRLTADADAEAMRLMSRFQAAGKK
jgi:biopolymer transport protein ExbB